MAVISRPLYGLGFCCSATAEGRSLMRFLRLADVRSKVGLSRSQIYRIVAAGDFPKPYSLGGRAVAWLEDDIDSWIKGKVQAAADQRGGQ